MPSIDILRPSDADWLSIATARAAEIAAARRPTALGDRRPNPRPPEPLTLEERKLFIKTGKFTKTKKGKLREESIRVSFLSARAGSATFNVTTRTDPAKRLAYAREILRICGPAAADAFRAAADAMPFKEPEEGKPRSAAGWNAPASGADCRRGCHTASRAVPLNYRKF